MPRFHKQLSHRQSYLIYVVMFCSSLKHLLCVWNQDISILTLYKRCEWSKRELSLMVFMKIIFIHKLRLHAYFNSIRQYIILPMQASIVFTRSTLIKIKDLTTSHWSKSLILLNIIVFLDKRYVNSSFLNSCLSTSFITA